MKKQSEEETLEEQIENLKKEIKELKKKFEHHRHDGHGFITY